MCICASECWHQDITDHILQLIQVRAVYSKCSNNLLNSTNSTVPNMFIRMLQMISNCPSLFHTDMLICWDNKLCTDRSQQLFTVLLKDTLNLFFWTTEHTPKHIAWTIEKYIMGMINSKKRLNIRCTQICKYMFVPNVLNHYRPKHMSNSLEDKKKKHIRLSFLSII